MKPADLWCRSPCVPVVTFVHRRSPWNLCSARELLFSALGITWAEQKADWPVWIWFIDRKELEESRGSFTSSRSRLALSEWKNWMFRAPF